MGFFGVALTIIVLVGIAMCVLLFERQRAARIREDLRPTTDQYRQGRPPTEED